MIWIFLILAVAIAVLTGAAVFCPRCDCSACVPQEDQCNP